MKTCVLCGKESKNVESFSVTDEARAMMEKRYPGANPDEVSSQTGICEDCLALPEEQRIELAKRATSSLLGELVLDAPLSKKPTLGARGGRFRIDVAKTIDLVTFPPEAWSWIDLLGDVLILTQQEVLVHEGFVADTPYKQLLVRAIHRDLSSLNAIYMLVRLEMLHQASALVRMLTESVITLRYIAKDLDNRVSQFLGYFDVEVYEIALSTLERERATAKPGHVTKMEAFVAGLRAKYEETKPKYVSSRGKKKRDFVNWCDASMPRQARDCGDDMVQLYEIVYSQLSAYVHGSAWSLRRQTAYSRINYDAGTVLVDIATIVRTTIYVWQRWAIFCDEQLGWTLSESFPQIVGKLAQLDSELEEKSA